MTLILAHVEPSEGPTYGGNLVRIEGPSIIGANAIAFGDAPALILDRNASSCVVRAPEHAAGAVDIVAFFGARADTASNAYTYAQGSLSQESDLTRLVRALLRDLKRHVTAHTAMAVDVAYAGPGESDAQPMVLATLPALILSGPAMRPNRTHAQPQRLETPGPNGALITYAPAATYDLVFSLTGSTRRVSDMLNLMHAGSLYTAQGRSIAIDRDPALPSAGQRRWALVPQGEVRSSIDDREGVRSFTAEFFIQAFDIESTLPSDLTTTAPDVHVDLDQGATPIA